MHIFNATTPRESSTTGSIGQFVYSKLFIGVLLRFKPELISFCRQQVPVDDQFELDILREFEENYSSERAIWWYTRESIVYKMLNKALRTDDIDLLFLFRLDNSSV